MDDEFVNNCIGPVKERFSQLEAQVIDISHNVNLLMPVLRNKLGIFKENGGTNAKDQSGER